MARRVCTMIAISLLLVAAACGTTSDKDKTATKDKTTTTAKPDTATTEKGDGTSTTEDDGGTTTTAPGGDKGDGSNPKFCEASAKLNTLFDNVEQDDYQGLVDAIANSKDEFEDYAKAAPQELKDDAKVLIDALQSLASEIDKIKDDPDAKTKAQAAFKKISGPDVEAAGKATDEYETKTCGNKNN